MLEKSNMKTQIYFFWVPQQIMKSYSAKFPVSPDVNINIFKF